MLDADIAAGAEVRICTIKCEKLDIQKLGKISVDTIENCKTKEKVFDRI